MLFSLLNHYVDLYTYDTALKLSQSLYYFSTSICHGIENYFPRLWGTGISDVILDLFWEEGVRVDIYPEIIFGLNHNVGTLGCFGRVVLFIWVLMSLSALYRSYHHE